MNSNDLAMREAKKSLSFFETPGFVYILSVEGSLFKVGRTKNLCRRVKEWKKQCPSNNVKLLYRCYTEFSHRLGEHTVTDIVDITDRSKNVASISNCENIGK